MSNDDNNIEILKHHVLEKLEYGENLIELLSKFNHIEGAQKLHRKIRQELNFLNKVHQQILLNKCYAFVYRFIKQIQLKKNIYNVPILLILLL